MYGQLFVFAMFFAVYRISTDGWSVTKTREFWISLFIHEEAKKETEAVEVKRTSADAGIECQTPMHPAL